MILKGSQRGGGRQMADHLLKLEENERVEIHEIRGFVANSLHGAMKEAQAISKGTQCRQYLFSLSLSPPETQSVRVGVFEKALEDIEERLGLTDQPRIVVFHEKEGRRHCHAVWSRIDADTMTAKQLSFFKTKLREVSKQLYLDNGWTMPQGLVDSRARDPRNFTLEEWQQARRAGLDAGAVKGMVQECWAASDNVGTLSRMLEERGLHLAKGDRRGHVIVSFEGEVFALSRLIDKKAKDVNARLGAPETLPSVAETKTRIAGEIAPKLSAYIREAKAIAHKAQEPLEAQRRALADKHQAERDRMDAGQRARRLAETQERAARLRGGFAGFWDRLTGEHSRTMKQNQLEAYFSLLRDRAQRDDLVIAQMKERRALQERIREVRRQNAQRILALYQEAARLRQMKQDREQGLRSDFREPARGDRPREQAPGRSARSERREGRSPSRRGDTPTPSRPSGPRDGLGRNEP
ncbi:MAG: relaxase/mobilization nuclease domain-containing protein [Alphaproteobacteria bacterium]|nr:relaxase/mobilization nuclease domain-containing protein [Alphaproteobacteria bacterium]